MQIISGHNGGNCKKIKEGQVHSQSKNRNRRKDTKQIASKKKKNWTLMYILPFSMSLYVFHCIVNFFSLEE